MYQVVLKETGWNSKKILYTGNTLEGCNIWCLNQNWNLGSWEAIQVELVQCRNCNQNPVEENSEYCLQCLSWSGN